MSLLYMFMFFYQDIFNPIYFLLICAFIVIYLDWKSAGGSLLVRIFTVTVSWIAAYIIYRMYFIFFPSYPQWVEDMFAVTGMSVAIIITYIIWKIKKYGKEMIGAIIASISVLVPYTIISPFWNISGHVAFTTAPVVYLYALDKRFVWLFVIPAIMIADRPIVGAHTIEQSVCGFILGLLAIIGVLYVKRNSNSKK